MTRWDWIRCRLGYPRWEYVDVAAGLTWGPRDLALRIRVCASCRQASGGRHA